MVNTGQAGVDLKRLIEFSLILARLDVNVDVKIHLEFVSVFCLFFGNSI